MITINIDKRLIHPDFIDIQACTYIEREHRCSEKGEYEIRFYVNKQIYYSKKYPNEYEALRIFEFIADALKNKLTYIIL